MSEWKNACAIPLAEVPVLSMWDFQDCVSLGLMKKAQLLALFGTPADRKSEDEGVRLFAVLGKIE